MLDNNLRAENKQGNMDEFTIIRCDKCRCDITAEKEYFFDIYINKYQNGSGESTAHIPYFQKDKKRMQLCMDCYNSLYNPLINNEIKTV